MSLDKSSHSSVVTNEITPNKAPQSMRGKNKKKKFKNYKEVTKADISTLLGTQEKAFYDALTEIATKFGYFDQESSGIWVGYESSLENQDSEIGVKCGNCAFHYDKTESTIGCKLLSFEVEENAKCRLAAIPDNLVNIEMDSENMNNEEININTDGMESVSKANSVSVGQMVSWNSSGGSATGKVIRIIRNGKYNVPNSNFVITGTPDDPAAAIRLYRDGKPTGTVVGHKVSTLRSVSKSVTKGLSSIFLNQPTQAKKTNTIGKATISLDIFDGKNGRDL